jgi:hypothetical protein
MKGTRRIARPFFHMRWIFRGNRSWPRNLLQERYNCSDFGSKKEIPDYACSP